MNQELIKCPCCDKLVSVYDIELSFLRPDDIALMDDEDIDELCEYNEDVFVIDEQYFYIRAILPLPVKDKDDDYNIGIWVQVEKANYEKIIELWDEESQSNEPPIPCIIANEVPLNIATKNSTANLKLTGPTSRPEVTIQNEASSLYLQQTTGITIHQASEYSDLCR